MTLRIGPAVYRFLPDPYLPAEMGAVRMIEGAESIIYQLQELTTGEFVALKVIKPASRSDAISRTTAALASFAQLKGLALADRVCLTRKQFPHLIATLPALEYAVIMPWLRGRSWAGFLLDRASAAAYTPAWALALTRMMAQVLWDLEAHHLAHTDLASGNVLLAPQLDGVELLDLEGMYLPGAPPPKRPSRGTPGYQHRLSSQVDRSDQWRPEGDRFAGAILLTEMLVWCDPHVRALTPPEAESLFQPLELQTLANPRMEAVVSALWRIWPPAVRLFNQAWVSPSLAACPELAAWAMCLLQPHQ